MRKKSLIIGIVFTILNIFATGFCGYLNAGIVYEGEGAIGLIAILPYTLIVMPFAIVFLVISLIAFIKAIKSESLKISMVAKIFLGINILIAIALVIMVIRLIPIFLNN